MIGLQTTFPRDVKGDLRNDFWFYSASRNSLLGLIYEG